MSDKSFLEDVQRFHRDKYPGTDHQHEWYTNIVAYSKSSIHIMDCCSICHGILEYQISRAVLKFFDQEESEK